MDELIAAVVANPDDDGPRLVLADALIERGDPWGEMIVIECELAAYTGGTRPWDDHARTLRDRALSLRRARFPQLAFETSERGFFTGVELSPGFDLATLVGPELALLDKITALSLPEHELDALAAWPRLAELRALRIEHHDEETRSSPAAAVRCIARAHRVTELEISLVGLARPHLAELLALPHVARLRRLSLYERNDIALDGLRWPRVDELDLAGCALGDANLAALLAGDELRDVRALDLSNCRLRDATPLARYPFTRLDELSLGGCSFGVHGLEALAANLGLKQLTSLWYEDAAEDISPALSLFATAFPRLDHLHLHAAVALRGLATIARPYRLLDLRIHGLAADELAALLVHPALATLRELWIFYAPTGAQLGAALAGARLPQLERLAIDAPLGEAGLRQLAAATHLPRELALSVERPGAVAEDLRARFRTYRG